MRTGTFILLLFVSSSSSAQQKVAKTDACYLLKRPLDCTFIEQNANEILKGDDNCVLGLIDSIYVNLTRTQEIKFLIALDSVAEKSDGYVSEDLMDVGANLFYHDLPLVTTYLIKKSTSKSKALERFIIEGLSMNLSLAKEPDKTRQKIVDFVEKQRKAQKISDESYTYIMRLLKKLDPKMFSASGFERPPVADPAAHGQQVAFSGGAS
jgi:hypothetical protein